MYNVVRKNAQTGVTFMKKSFRNISLGLACLVGVGGAVTAFTSTSRPSVEAHASYSVLEYVNFKRLYEAPWEGNNRNVDLTGSQDNTPWLRASGWGASPSDLKANEVTLGNYGARLWYTGGYVTFSVNLTAESELDDVYFAKRTYMGDEKISIPCTVSSGKYVYSHTYRMGNTNLKPFFHMDGENKKVTDFHFYILDGDASASSIVQLNTNGGSGGTGWVEASWNSAMPAITKPTRTGYTFDGYYDAPSGGNKYYNANGSSARTYQNGDATTLFAHWVEAKYTVTLNKNGGSGGTNSVVATKGSAMPTISSLPTRAGYTFAGYYSATSGGTKYYNANGTSAKNFDKDANTTLYAQWTANEYTVTYKANGGSVSPASFKYKTNKNTTTSTDQNFTLATPTRTGYTFNGWSTSKSGTSISNKTALKINGNTYGNFDVTASWSVIPYTITYNLDGGTVSGTNPTQYNVETATFSLINPTKVGYDFVGWTGSCGSTPQTSVSIAKGSTGNKTYTANWAYNTNVQSFLDKVDAIGEVSYGAGSSSKADIDAASNAYLLLSDGEKALADVVARHDVLDQAIDEYNAQKADAIAGYVAKVDALKTEAQNDPNNVEYNETYETLLRNIRDAYANLETAELSDPTIVAAHDAYAPYQVKYDSLVGDVQQAFIDKVNMIYEAAEGDYANVAYNETFRALINGAKEAYAAIRDADKGASAVVSKKTELDTAESFYLAGAEAYAASVKDLIAAIEPITVETSASDAAISAARTGFDALFPEQKNDPAFISANIPNYQRLLDAEAANPVAKQILAIGASSESDFADKVAAAQIAYNALSAGQKALISGAVSGILSDDVAALNAMNLIAGIGDVAYTAESKGKIDAARSAYDALTPAQKALVVNLDVLTKAEADYAAVKAVVDEVNAIGNITYDDASKTKIISARANYEALSDDQKGFFPASTKDLLENYEAAYAVMGKIVAIGTVENTSESVALVADAATAYNAYQDFSINLLDPEITQILLDDLQIVDAMVKINAIGEVVYTPECKALIDTAKSAYDSLSPAVQALVPNADNLAKAYADYTAVDAVAQEVKAIGDITYDNASKAKIDAARSHYEDLTADQKAFFPIEWLENYEEAYAVMGKINAIGKQEDTPESAALVKDAQAAYVAYKAAHEENRLDSDYEQALLDHVAAREAIDKINAVGKLEYNEACKGRIDAARSYYDTLTDSQKLNVANYNELIKAEADFAAVKGVADEVNTIGDITYDSASKAKIDAARADYEKLSADQKAFFPIAELEAYEAAYNEMDKIAAIGKLANTSESKALVEAAKAGYDALSEGQKDLLDPAYEKTLLDNYAALLVMEKINAIGDVNYTPECKDKIDAARAAYEALSDDQKSILPNYEFLTKGEQSFNEQKTTATVLSSVFLGVSAIALVAGVLFLIRLLKKKNSQGMTKVKSISILPLFILTSYYLSGLFIALYIVAAFAVAVWAANLVIGLRNKKNKPVLAQVPATTNPEAASEEVAIVDDEKGNDFQIRFVRSFQAKLSQSDDTVKNYYNVLKNHALSYKKASSRISWNFDSINVGRTAIIKFAVRGKTLCLYLALNADEYIDTKYKVEKAESRKFEGVSCLYRIKNDRRLDYAKDLIDVVMNKFNVEKGKKCNEDFRIPYEETKVLLEKGLIKEAKTKVQGQVEEHHHTSITMEEADKEMSDEKAEAAIEEDTIHHHQKGSKEIVNIDTLSQNYNDGDEVTLESLKEKKLVSSKAGYVKVLARGRLDKKLTVDLDDYSLQAVKMIVLLGGHAKKIK